MSSKFPTLKPSVTTAAEAQARVAQMCQEFHELAEGEVDEKKRDAEERAASEYDATVSNTKDRLDAEFARQETQINRDVQIREAQIKNNVKLEVLKSQNEAIHEALKEAIVQLSRFSEGPDYPELMKKLIAEGLDRMRETRVRLMVRKSDLPIAQKVLPDAVQIAQEKNPGLVIKAKVDDSRFLAQAPACAGGVVLIAQKGKIRVSNVLNERLKLAYEGLLPQIRQLILSPPA
jgi:V-type H+-transporting ATPase subunit E